LRQISDPFQKEGGMGLIEDAFDAAELEADMVAVVPFQGPKANGMPELHKLTPYLGVLQNKDFRVALVTDGRMSGASGKILAAIQVAPEAADNGFIGRIQNGDIISIDANAGTLEINVDLAARTPMEHDNAPNETGMGRELFSAFRKEVGPAESGASIF
jgi:phosphogluconate dehydratase